MIYIASPLFSEQERKFNSLLAATLEEKYIVFLPQRDGLLLVDIMNDGSSYQLGAERVFSSDISAIRRCDLVIGVLDGRVVDEGVSFELGFAYALGKKIIAYQSDSRRLFPEGNNPMLHCAIDAYFGTISDICAGVDAIAGT